MRTYNIHAGFNNYVKGATGYFDGVPESRKLKDLIIKKLRQNGDIVHDCTDDHGMDTTTNLKNIVEYHNQYKADLNISLHFNADPTGNANGVEVYYRSEDANDIASNICSTISDRLRFCNRGARSNDLMDLWVLNRIQNPVILIECCFVTSKLDCDRYNREAMADAIVDALIKTPISIKESDK